MLIKAHKIRLEPNAKQEKLLWKSAGVSRFSYNWALAKWKELYEKGEKVTELKLRNLLTEIKRQEFPWMLEVSKTCPQHAIMNLGRAFKRFFTKKAKYPKFKKKGVHDSFRADNGCAGSFKVNENKIRLRRIGWIKISESLRFQGKLKSAIVSRRADHWYVSISVETEETLAANENQVVVGVDLGIKDLATLSTGEVVPNHRVLKSRLRRLKILQRRVSRRVKGSHRHWKAKTVLAKLHARIYFLRQDILHKLTTHLAKDFGTIVIEDLNVKGMLKNHCLAQAISDASFGEFRRQLTYKCEWYGSKLIVADRFYPSSKTCMHCGHKLDVLPLSVREWDCPGCGRINHRDLTAANNLAKLGRVPPEVTLVKIGVQKDANLSQPITEARIKPVPKPFIGFDTT